GSHRPRGPSGRAGQVGGPPVGQGPEGSSGCCYRRAWHPRRSGGLMVPWLWLWAPQLNLPWSGDVAQEIEPTTSWVFRGIRPSAGDGEIEEKSFSIASYGKQL